MAGLFHHEAIYRGTEALDRLGATPVTLCGAGALGSLLADNLARQGIRQWVVIDRDRVEEHNIGTQLYGESDIGAWKVEALRARLFRTVGADVRAVPKELTERNVRTLLKGASVVLEAFDHSRARRLVQNQCRAQKTVCLHVGLSAEYAEAIWDENYRVPDDTSGDLCDYPLARNLVLFAVALASEVFLRRTLEEVREDWSITLRDFAVRPLAPR